MNRWHSIGRTRRKLAEILTAYVRGLGGGKRFPDAVVEPEDIYAMRLVGKMREWEDAPSWEAFPRFCKGSPNTCMTLYSYDNMTKCVRAGVLHPIGKDGELSV
jgi:hypothetical protein